jgi:hypothetical protein
VTHAWREVGKNQAQSVDIRTSASLDGEAKTVAGPRPLEWNATLIEGEVVQAVPH